MGNRIFITSIAVRIVVNCTGDNNNTYKIRYADVKETRDNPLTTSSFLVDANLPLGFPHTYASLYNLKELGGFWLLRNMD